LPGIEWEGRTCGGGIAGEMWLIIPQIGRAPARRPWEARRD
jgi:hypothetical protein